MTAPLVSTPRLHLRESFLGYLLRVSESNGYPLPTYVMSLAGLTDHEARRCHLPLEKLASVLNYSPADLAPITWQPSNDSGHDVARLRGHGFLARSLCLQHPKICPECIEEKSFAKAAWDIALMVGCPKHDRPLLWRCPGCGKRLTWLRPGLLKCSCGAELCESAKVRLAPALREFLDYVQRRFHGEDTKPLYPARLLPLYAFEPMSLQALVLLVEIVGKCACGHMGRNRNNGKAVDDAWYLRVAQAGAEALSNWPSNLHRMLSQLVDSGGGNEESLKQIDEALYKNSTAHDRFTFVKMAIMDYENERHFMIDPRRLKSVSIGIQESKLLSLKQYAVLANVDIRAVRKAIDLGILAAKKVPMDNTVRYFVDTEVSPPHLAKQTGETYSLRRTALFLGLSEQTVSKLRDLGSLRPTHIPVPPTCFRIEDLRRFREEMMKRAGTMEMRDYDPNAHIRLSAVKSQLVSRWPSKAHVIHAIYTRELIPIGRLGESIQDIVIPRRSTPSSAAKCAVTA